MRHVINISLFLLVITLSYSQNPNFVWAGQFSGNGCNNIGISIKTDALGNVYSTGTFDTITDFDPGPGTYTLQSYGLSDVYVNKLDASGNFVWAKQLGGNFVEYTSSMFVDNSSNVYTTGYYYSSVADFDPGPGTYSLTKSGSGSVFISKLNSIGNFVWAKQFDGGRAFSHSIFVDAFGSVIVCGTFKDTVDFDPGPSTATLASTGGSSNGYISKLDANGNFVWVKQIEGTNLNSVKSVVSDGAGNIYCSGIFQGTADFDPNAGIYNMTMSTYQDLFILKLDVSGNFIWAKQIGGGTGIVDATAIGLDASNNIFATGSFDTSADFDPGIGVFNLITGPYFDMYVLKLDVSGNFIWAKQIGGPGTEWVKALDIDINNNIYTVGTFDDTTDFDPSLANYTLSPNGNTKIDIFISKLDNSGNFVWARQLGDTSFDEGYGLNVDLNFNVYTTGYFRLTPDFDIGSGTFTLTGLGGRDAFVHKMCQLSCLSGIEEKDLENDFILYPNPASDKLFFTNRDAILNNYRIEILNCLGQVIRKENLKNEIDVSNLADGFYTIRIISKDQNFQKRMVITK